MAIELVKVIAEILTSDIPLVPAIFRKAQRNESILKILKKFKIDPKDIPNDFEGIYVYSLIEYGINENGLHKPEEVLEIFRLPEIKEAFRQAFYSRNKFILNETLTDIISWQHDWNILGNTIRNSRINLPDELEQFSDAFIKVLERAQTPAQRRTEQKIDDLKEKLENVIGIIDKITNRNHISDTCISDTNVPGCPQEFQALIQEKIRSFCGRQFVFEALEQFINKNPKGYFTIVGNAGMGKSAIAAKYVSIHSCPCYFNILAERRNRPELFLESIRKQLILRYQLQNAEQDNLPTLLEKVSDKLDSDENLVIVVDALDEVDQATGTENLLYLPKMLPNRVYFLLTRRPYEQGKKRLFTEGVAIQELNLNNEYFEISREDIKEYIRFFISEDSDYKDALQKWIQLRNINSEDFIEQVAIKSENNFMYLRYVLPEIANGLYENITSGQLPDGLQEYYQIHWQRMGMDSAPRQLMLIILFILVANRTPIPCEMIAQIADEDEFEVQKVLNEWYEYLKPQILDGDICYSIYHSSFLDFLKSKRDLKANRKLFTNVNQRIVDFWENEMNADELDENS